MNSHSEKISGNNNNNKTKQIQRVVDGNGTGTKLLF